MKRTIVAITALGLLAGVAPVDAQDRWSMEIRANGAFPSQGLSGGELETGMGFEGAVRYRFLPHLSAYAGWDWIRFSADQSFAGSEMDFEETGYVFGLRFEHPIRPLPSVAWWVRAGGTYDHIEIEDSDGDLAADSGHGLGWEAGGGLALGVGRGWSLTPGVRYRALSRDLEINGTTTPMDLEYVAVEVGIARIF